MINDFLQVGYRHKTQKTFKIKSDFVSDVCNGLDEPPNAMCDSLGGDMDYDDDQPCSPLGATEVKCEAMSNGPQLRERKDFQTVNVVEQKVFCSLG